MEADDGSTSVLPTRVDDDVRHICLSRQYSVRKPLVPNNTNSVIALPPSMEGSDPLCFHENLVFPIKLFQK